MKTKTTILEIEHDDLVNLFSTALYDHRNMTAMCNGEVPREDGDCYEDMLAKCLLLGGSISVVDRRANGEHYGSLPCVINEDDDAVYTVTLQDVTNGLERACNGEFNLGEMSSSLTDLQEIEAHWAFHSFERDSREWDAGSADILIQVIVFDEIVYI